MAKCALVVGHKKTSPGAFNENSAITEFNFNDRLAMDIEDAVTEVETVRVYRRTYNQLPADINELGSDFTISLHCNAFNREASGTEVLYYYKSEKGKNIAHILQKSLVAALGLNDRGIKPKTAEDRGGFLLKYTNMPCLIAEPFFIDNDEDLAKASSNRDVLVKAYAGAIVEIANSI